MTEHIYLNGEPCNLFPMSKSVHNRIHKCTMYNEEGHVLRKGCITEKGTCVF